MWCPVLFAIVMLMLGMDFELLFVSIGSSIPVAMLYKHQLKSFTLLMEDRSWKYDFYTFLITLPTCNTGFP